MKNLGPKGPKRKRKPKPQKPPLPSQLPSSSPTTQSSDLQRRLIPRKPTSPNSKPSLLPLPLHQKKINPWWLPADGEQIPPRVKDLMNLSPNSRIPRFDHPNTELVLFSGVTGEERR